MAANSRIQELVGALLASGEAQAGYQVKAHIQGLPQLRGEFKERRAAQIAAQLLVETAVTTRCDVVQRVFSAGQLLAETAIDTYLDDVHIDRALGTVDGVPARAMAILGDPEAPSGVRRIYARSLPQAYTAALAAMTSNPCLTYADVNAIDVQGDDWGIVPPSRGATHLYRRAGSVVPGSASEQFDICDAFDSEEGLAAALMAMAKPQMVIAA